MSLSVGLIKNALKLEEAKNRTEATKIQLKEVEGEQLSAEQKAATAERILDHEEMIVKNICYRDSSNSV